MRKTMAALTVAIGALAATPHAILSQALAQSAEPKGSMYDQLVQEALNEGQIKRYIAAQGEMEAAMGEAPADAGDKPDPKVMAKLEAVAKKYKYASYDEFDGVAGNIALVLDGVDPKTKKYVGPEALLKQEIAEVKADAKMAAADKKEALQQLNDQLKTIVPLKFPANIELVLKYYDALAGEEAQKQ